MYSSKTDRELSLTKTSSIDLLSTYLHLQALSVEDERSQSQDRNVLVGLPIPSIPKFLDERRSLEMEHEMRSAVFAKVVIRE